MELLNRQGWKFTQWLFALLLKITLIIELLRVICSYCSLKKSDCEQIALVALNKRGSVSNSLRSLMTNKWPWANDSRLCVKKSNMSDLLVTRANWSLKWAICSGKKHILCFWHFFTAFPFYTQEQISPVALHSVFTKEWLWAICSPRSFKKSAIGVTSLEKSKSIVRSFVHKQL